MSAPTVWCVRFEAVPEEGAEGPSDARGALVDCWVKSEDRDAAVREAQDAVIEAGWRVEGLDFVDEARTRDMSADARVYYEEALREGICLAFFVWTEDDEPERDTQEPAKG